MKKTPLIVLLAVLSLTISAQTGTTTGQTLGNGPMNATAGPINTTAFVQKNMRDNMHEIRMLQMGQRKTNDSQIVKATRVMISDHQQMLADMRRYARMNNMNVGMRDNMDVNGGGMDNLGAGSGRGRGRRGSQAGTGMNTSDNMGTSANDGNNMGTTGNTSDNRRGTTVLGQTGTNTSGNTGTTSNTGTSNNSSDNRTGNIGTSGTGTGTTGMNTTGGTGTGNMGTSGTTGNMGTGNNATAGNTTGTNTLGNTGNNMGTSGNSGNNMGTGHQGSPGVSGSPQNNVGTSGGNTMDASTGTNNTRSWSGQGNTGIHGDMGNMQHMRAVEQQLMGVSGADFNLMWANHMTRMHEAKLSELQNASANLTDMELKRVVDKAIPKVQQHIQMLSKLNGGTKPTNQ